MLIHNQHINISDDNDDNSPRGKARVAAAVTDSRTLTNSAALAQAHTHSSER